MAMRDDIAERRKKVLELLREDGGISVNALSDELGVSAVTLRSDLSALAEQGLIVRARGGALPAFHQKVLDRQKSCTLEKARIARAGAALIEDGDTVMVVAGTTTSLVVKYLLGRTDVKVVTNSTLVVPYARVSPALHVTFTGGEFLPWAEAMVGANTLRSLEQFHVGTAFVGTDGFSVESGITADNVAIAEVVMKMASQANRTVLLADSSKYGKAGFAHIMALIGIDFLITDSGLPDEARVAIESAGVTVELV